jgi:polyhydroxyalkanoate synthase
MKTVTNSPFAVSYNHLMNLAEFTTRYYEAMFSASIRTMEVLSGLEKEELNKKKIRDVTRATFDASFREMLKKEDFCKSLSKLMDSYVDYASYFHFDKIYRNYEAYLEFLDSFVEPIRDSVNRTPADVIKMDGRFDVHHYRSSIKPKYATPILVVGSLINRHYILDLLPQVSIIRYFQDIGFDVYATDWRTPTARDVGVNLETYAHDFLENAVDKVEEITGSKQVTLFGYCWGGIFALIYSALHPKDVKNLILHATPVDLGNTTSVIEYWTKSLNVEKFVDIFGNVPPSFLNVAFLMRNPLEAYLKYFYYFDRQRTTDEIIKFFSVEFWLYDSVPIIGKAFEKIIEDIYKDNLLINNKMKLGEQHVNLDNITMPVLNIVGTRDDLVPPESCRTTTNVIPSKDKQIIEFPTGHVGLCISSDAHEKLWPKVGKWLVERS